MQTASGHTVRPVKLMTDEAKEALRRIELIEGIEKEREMIRNREAKRERVNHEQKVLRAV